MTAVALSRCVAVALALAACTNDPPHLVMRAAAAAPEALPVRMIYRVATSGEQAGILYLNSEADYRDPRNVSLDVPPRVRAALAARLGGDPAVVLQGRRVRVTGQAQRQTTYFLTGGRPSGKYYYQTHIRIDDPAQLRLLRR